MSISRIIPDLYSVLIAMGYNRIQIHDFERTIDRTSCGLFIFATSIHLPRVLTINKPTIRIRYEYKDHGALALEDLLSDRMEK